MRRCASGALLLYGGPGRSPWAASRSGRYDSPMPERPRKRPADLNRLAASIVEESTDEEPRDPPARSEGREKNAAAVELGRRGGLKGGRARAEKLTPEQRVDSARRAALARWHRAD
jgi:hypothetical protein